MRNLFLLVLFSTITLYPQNWDKIDSVFSPGGVTVQAFTAPIFGDLDNDGDFDLVLGSSGLEIEYFENTGSNLSPVFHKDTSMFSSIYGGGYQYTNSYYPALYDLDGDGDLDLTIGGYNGILYYENIGSPSNPIWADVNTTLFADANSQIGTDARQTFADLDNDGDADMVVGIGESLLGGPTPGISMGFRNIGTAFAPEFQRDDDLVIGIPDVGLNAYPALADLDNDGDYDLLIGRDGAAVYFYRNTGTPAVPAWTIDNTIFSVVETINYWKDPVFCDLDGDNDQDLIYGTSNGNLFFYENTGSISDPQYQYNPAYFKVIKASGSSTVSFADYDNDGDFDLLSGSPYNGLVYAVNNGSSSAPLFDTASVIFSGISPGFRCSPVFIDIDNDMDYDIVSGYSGGTLKLYINNNGTFTENTTMFANVFVNYQSVPAFADIDGDNDPDLLVGSEDAGNTKFYLNDGNNNFTQNTTIFSGVSFPSFCRPAFADIDNDGDFDLFIGRLSGSVNFYENTGDRFNPVWTLNNQLTAQVNVKQNAHPGFADLDGDGRTDLIVGEYDGNFTFYKNLFAIIPVELTSFNASVMQSSVCLTWTTATETNNRGFEVEREVGSRKYGVGSKRNEVSDWEKVGYVAGFGTTTEPKSYSFTDENVSSGRYSYRLKQIDFDGSITYSNIVEIEVNTSMQFALEQNYPNPFNPSTQIDFRIPEDGYVTLKVYNSLGERVADLVDGYLKAGQHKVSFDGSRLSSGVYYYRIESDSKSLVRKMMLVK
jgi:hypothetical protein